MEKKRIITLESIMNFKINDAVQYQNKKGRIENIDGSKFLIYFNKKESILIHYSFLRLIKHSRPQDYNKWSKKEIELLSSGLSPKQLSKKLNRNRLCIYNKIRRLGLDIFKEKSEKQLLKETYLKTRLKKTHALSDEFVGGNKINK